MNGHASSDFQRSQYRRNPFQEFPVMHASTR